MACEIEYKFLITDNSIIDEADSFVDIKQGYFVSEVGIAIRIRICNDKAILCIKGAVSHGNLKIRNEFEYEIPYDDGIFMLENFCKGRCIEKRRYFKKIDNLTWEIDVFSGKHEGLIFAELEVPSVDTKFDKPSWVGEDVSNDFRYSNHYLACKK